MNYKLFPNPAALANALAQPIDLVFSPKGDRIFVAAFGTDRIGVLDAQGRILNLIEVGNTPGTKIDSRNKRGPRGLAHHQSLDILYCFNRLTNNLTVLDTKKFVVIQQVKPLHDPAPKSLREGRGFLYDAKLSGNGTMSCATCHIDADIDGLAWDLGNPAGDMKTVRDPRTNKRLKMHPMKGPMTTQTLEGLKGLAPFHWRGDKAKLEDFNPAFASLLGGKILSSTDIASFARFMESIAFPPNPNQKLDRTLSTQPVGQSPKDGESFFLTQKFTPPAPLKCVDCHALPSGTNGTFLLLSGKQAFKTPQLRNLYKRQGRLPVNGKRMSGFGLLHDGSVDRIFDLLTKPIFGLLSQQAANKTKLENFVRSFDTGTAPTVGFTQSVDRSNINRAPVLQNLTTLLSQAKARNCDVIAKGVLDERLVGMKYSPASDSFQLDYRSGGSLSSKDLLARIQAGRAILSFIGVPPGSAQRIGIDRDLDGTLDGDEGLVNFGKATPLCESGLRIFGNSDPTLGNLDFALGAGQVQARMPGLLLLGTKKANVQLLGITLHVKLLSGLIFPWNAGPSGFAIFPIPIPNMASLKGTRLYFQAAFGSTCAPQGIAASNGLELTIVMN